MYHFYTLSLFFSALLLLQACQSSNPPPYSMPKETKGKSAMVVSAHPLASEIGLQVLKDGGNAIDAMVAVHFALAVSFPRAGNIGGGGFLVYRSNKGNAECLDFRESAPALADKDMYLDSLGEPIDSLSLVGTLAAGVPGSVAGMFQAHQRHGKLSWANLIQPAIDLARQGVLVTNAEAKSMNKYQATFKKHNRHLTAFEKNWKMGDHLIQEELAQTLELIRDKGIAGFYEGPTAQKIVDEMKANNGIIQLSDLKNYKAIWRAPIRSPYKEYELISMPPPSSGGICLASMLNMLENIPLKTYGFQSPQAMHAIVEAERRAYADRAKHLGDADFYPVPIAQLLDKQYAQRAMHNFDATRASFSDSIQAGKFTTESEETTHYSIVDKEGNAVSVTTTINSNYGAKVVVKGAGFFLNNEMDDFSIKAGTPNQFGLVGAEANAIAPQKRMLSSMTPTIVCKEGKLFMVVGTPGGSTIITSVLQTILNVIEFDLDLKQAVHSPRFHHQCLPDVVYHERDFDSTKLEGLKKLGHQLKARGSIGRVDAILIRNGLTGVADCRGDDTALGY